MNAGASSTTSAVSLRGVTKRFGPRAILDNIDLEIAAGEVFVLVGPSGSGKSTLLKMVSGIERPDSGRVLLRGVDCTDEPPYRRAVHTVFQSYALFPHLDVADNVAFPLAVAGMPRAARTGKVEEALAWVRLAGYGTRRIENLSGGERQRVALARALVDQPECVLFDEPLSALDPHLRSSTLELLQDIQARLGMTCLYVTHDRDEALRIGHRVGVLNHGRLEQVAPPEDIYRRPSTAFVASFLGRINWIAAEACDGKWRLSAAAECVLPDSIAHHAAHGKWKIGVRPEDVTISASGFCPATVLSRQFTGESHLVRVRLADGSQMLVDERGEGTPVAPGQPVLLAWDPGRAHAFAADEEAAP